MVWQFPLKAIGESWVISRAGHGVGRHSCLKISTRVADAISDTDVWSEPQQQRDKKKSLINFNALWIRPSLIGTCWSVVLLLPPFEKQSLWTWDNKKERIFCGCSKHSRWWGPLFTSSSATLHCSLQSKHREKGKRTEEWTHSAENVSMFPRVRTSWVLECE